MINVREAILKAADSIEANPHLFDFESLSVPDPDCGTPGCALGWIAYHSGIKVARESNGRRLWGQNNEFICAFPPAGMCTFPQLTEVAGNTRWFLCATECASALRKYADKYHPAEKPMGIPDDVLKIFQPKAAA